MVSKQKLKEGVGARQQQGRARAMVQREGWGLRRERGNSRHKEYHVPSPEVR